MPKSVQQRDIGESYLVCAEALLQEDVIDAGLQYQVGIVTVRLVVRDLVKSKLSWA